MNTPSAAWIIQTAQRDVRRHMRKFLREDELLDSSPERRRIDALVTSDAFSKLAVAFFESSPNKRARSTAVDNWLVQLGMMLFGVEQICSLMRHHLPVREIAEKITWQRDRRAQIVSDLSAFARELPYHGEKLKKLAQEIAADRYALRDSVEAWADVIEPTLLGKSGAASSDKAAVRGLVIYQVYGLVPACTAQRYAVTRALLEWCGVGGLTKTSVRSIVTSRERPR